MDEITGGEKVTPTSNDDGAPAPPVVVTLTLNRDTLQLEITGNTTNAPVIFGMLQMAVEEVRHTCNMQRLAAEGPLISRASGSPRGFDFHTRRRQ